MTSGRKPTHGHASRRLGVSPEYKVWEGIRERCHNPNSKDYPRYGGRGITVCPQWLSSFSTFLADMGHRPSAQHSIERRENDGPYSPGNCKWATRAEQSRNRRTNHFVEVNGVRMCVTDAAIAHGMSPDVVHARLGKGWPLERALSEPVGSYAQSILRFVELDGTRLSVAAVARAAGLPPGVVARRLDRGWPPSRALTTPVERKRRDAFVQRDGRRVRAFEVAVLVGMPLRTLARRLKQGWDAERALTTPVDPCHERSASR